MLFILLKLDKTKDCHCYKPWQLANRTKLFFICPIYRWTPLNHPLPLSHLSSLTCPIIHFACQQMSFKLMSRPGPDSIPKHYSRQSITKWQTQKGRNKIMINKVHANETDKAQRTLWKLIHRLDRLCHNKNFVLLQPSRQLNQMCFG